MLMLQLCKKTPKDGTVAEKLEEKPIVRCIMLIFGTSNVFVSLPL